MVLYVEMHNYVNVITLIPPKLSFFLNLDYIQLCSHKFQPLDENQTYHIQKYILKLIVG